MYFYENEGVNWAHKDSFIIFSTLQGNVSATLMPRVLTTQTLYFCSRFIE